MLFHQSQLDPTPAQSSQCRILCRGLGAGGRGWGRRFCRSRPAGRVSWSRVLSCGELAVKFSVAANPNPNPHIGFKSLCDGAVIPRHPHRPETWIGTQPFQLQGRLRRILEKLLMCDTGGFLEARRERVVSLPELLRAQ